VDFQIDRSDLHTARFVEPAVAPLAEGEARLAVQAFAVTANTITYGVVGERFGYGDAFPIRPADPGDDGRSWGRLPAWGVAEVVESRSELVPLGMRVRGFVPMSSEVVLTPGKVDPGGFSDVANHRSGLAPVYNRYRTLAVTDEPLPTIDELRRMVHEPLFMTSLMIDDLLSAYTGLDHVVISSASSKTAIATAHHVGSRGGVEVVGLTSPGNRTFVEDLGLYDRVLTYDGLAGLPTGTAAHVDIAGSARIRAGVHGHYADRLRLSLLVGQTHWDQASGVVGQRLPGPRPTPASQRPGRCEPSPRRVRRQARGPSRRECSRWVTRSSGRARRAVAAAVPAARAGRRRRRSVRRGHRTRPARGRA